MVPSTAGIEITPDMVRCENCFFCKHGGCHRNPPIPNPTTIGQGTHLVSSMWPCVEPDDYCGEFVPRMHVERHVD